MGPWYDSYAGLRSLDMGGGLAFEGITMTGNLSRPSCRLGPKAKEVDNEEFEIMPYVTWRLTCISLLARIL